MSRRAATGAGSAGDPGWAAAVVLEDGRTLGTSTTSGALPAPFEPGLLAMREGPLLDMVTHALSVLPELLVVHAAGRDHPRRAGLALHLGWALGIPTVGVTDRPLLARGPAPAPVAGSTSPLELEGERVGYLVRTRAGAPPIAAHAAWRVGPEVAAEIVLALSSGTRTPRPLRAALALARAVRAAATGAGGQGEKAVDTR